MSVGLGAYGATTGMDTAAMLERLGVPGTVSSALGDHIDGVVDQAATVLRTLTDMYSHGMQAGVQSLFGAGLPPMSFVPRPCDAMHHGHAAGAQGFNPFGGFSTEAPFGEGLVGQSVESAVSSNPLFKSSLERALGGIIVPDGATDGRLSVYRPPLTLGSPLAHAIAGGALAGRGMAAALAGLTLPYVAAGAVTHALARTAANIAAFAQSSQLMGAGTAASTAGAATGAAGGAGSIPGAKGWAATLSPEETAFAKGMGIDIRSASFEDVLFMLLMKYAKKKEDDIMKKVKELDKSMQQPKGKEAEEKKGKGGKGGLLGGIASIAGSLIGGPVGGIVSNIFSSGGGGGVGGGGGGGGGEGTGLYGSNLGENLDPSKMSDTMKQQMLQKLMGDLQKLYEMLSNIIKTMHDMAMTPTRNLRVS
jgi:hypothetical protein